MQHLPGKVKGTARQRSVQAALNAHPAFDAPFLIDPNLIIGTNIFHDLDSEKLQVL